MPESCTFCRPLNSNIERPQRSGPTVLWRKHQFAINHFADIERIAMVGDKGWQQGMAIFCKLFTTAAVQYFDHADAPEARKWVAET
jgi:hypothetical protein